MTTGSGSVGPLLIFFERNACTHAVDINMHIIVDVRHLRRTSYKTWSVALNLAVLLLEGSVLFTLKVI